MADAADGGQEQPERPERYAVRFTPRADRESIEAAARVADLTGDDLLGRDWYAGLQARAAMLTTNPRGNVLVPGPRGARFRREVCRLVYRRPGSSRTSPAYLVLYAVEDDTPDGPVVMILAVRHAARKPLTPEEARAIEAGQDDPNP